MNEKTALRLVSTDYVCMCVCAGLCVRVGRRNGHSLQGLERSLCSGSNQANNMFAKKYLHPTVELLGQLTHVMCWTSGNKIANFHSEQPTLFPVFDKPRNCTSSQTHPLCPHLSFL